MKLDARHLEIIAAIVENGGLTEGAEALGKSQPSVSRTVAMLEARVGARLFEKNRRPLQPTDLCLALAVEGRKVLAANQTASALVRRYIDGKSGVVRVGGTPFFMDGVISAMIAEFQRAYPEIRIEQSYAYAADLSRQLDSNALDVAICPMDPAALPEKLAFSALLDGRNVIACSPTHPLAGKSSLRLTEIAPYPWIAPPVESPLYQDLRSILAGIGMTDFKVSFSGGTLASILNILARSDALTVLPYSVVFMLRRQQALAALPIRINHPERSLGQMWSPAQSDRPSVRRFRRFIDAEFSNLRTTIMKHEQNSLWRR
jgi:DNA-binding transcriptional LysR family regulator